MLLEVKEFMKNVINKENASIQADDKPNLTPVFCFVGCNEKWKIQLLLKFYSLLYYQDDNQEHADGDVGRNGNKARKLFSKFIVVIDKIVENQPIDYSKFKESYRRIFECVEKILESYSYNQKKRFAHGLKLMYEEYTAECELYDGSKSQEDVYDIVFKVYKFIKVINYNLLFCKNV